ncbi:ABC transporter permease [Gemmatimonadota bacterium]
MGSFLQDIRFSLRTLRKNPGFAIIAVLSLALGIGANTAIYSVYSSTFLKDLPVTDVGTLVDFYTFDPEEDFMEYSVSSYPDFIDFQEQSRDVLEDMMVFNIAFLVHDTGEESSYLFGEEVSANFFDVLGVGTVLGRTFIPEEEGILGAPPTAVIGHSLWQNQFGGDPGIIGETIALSGLDFTIIGVLPPEFQGMWPIQADVWYPMTLVPQIRPDDNQLVSRGSRSLWIKGRLKEGVTIDQAEAALQVISARLSAEYPETNTGLKAMLLPTEDVSIHPEIDGIIKGFTLTLMAVIGLVLLIACINLASMLLARAVSRQKEIGVRLALGAGRFRLIRQLITESTLLSILGGLAGVALAYWLIQILLAVQPPTIIPINLDINIDGNVLLFALFLSVGTGILFGLLPAWQTTRYELISTLKDGTGFMSGRLRRFGSRSILVVAQVAVSVVLLICAGLFLRSLGNASSVDPGFDLRDGVVATYELGEGGRFTVEESRAFSNELLSRIEALPGVEAACLTDRLPLGQGISITEAFPETDHMEIGEDGVPADIATVGPGYFRTMGIPLVFGRPFASTDLPESERVVIVNEFFAKTYWPDEIAIGKQVRVYGDDGPLCTIVGVALNGKYRSLGERDRSFIYLPDGQDNMFLTNLVVRTIGGDRDFIQTIRSEIRTLDAHVPILDIITFREHLQLMLFLPQMLASLLTGLGLLSLILGTTGLYGVIAYDVSRRTREVGIRMSVGAQQSQVVRLIMMDGIKLVGIGTVIGLGIALFATKALETMLFNISPFDPVTFLGVTVLFFAVAVVATMKPARRASAVNPVEALRSE